MIMKLKSLGMKKQIDQIVITNLKKHEKFTADPKGNHFLLVGANGAGKTTVLDLIRRLLGMKVEKPDEPIRQGAEAGAAGIYVSNANGEKYYVEEKYTKNNKGRLKFYRVNGAHKDELTPTMERLQLAIGVPIDFSQLIDMEGEKQLDFFKENLGLDFSTYDHNYENLFDNRTLVNREIKTLQAKLLAPELRVFGADIDTYREIKKADDFLNKKVDMRVLYDKRNAAERANERYITAKQKQTGFQRTIEVNTENIEQLMRLLKSMPEGLASFPDLHEQINLAFTTKLNAAKRDITFSDEQLKIANEWFERNDMVDIEAINAEIDAAQTTNAAIDEELRGISEWNANVEKVRNYVEAERQLKEKQAEAARITKELTEMDQILYERLSSIRLADLVPGLELIHEVGEDAKGKMVVKRAGLFMDSLPFTRSQQSYGQMLKAIIKLSAHFNAGKLNFIPIGNWNLLDDEGKAEVLALAKENPDLGIQLGIEKVDNNKEIITEIIEA